MRRWLLGLAALSLAVSGYALLGGGAAAYVGKGRTWPGGVIRYYNAAPDQAWAVQQAVTAWNRSGARIRFVAVPASQAQVRIEHFRGVNCTVNAEATGGYTPQARVWIFRRDDTSLYCNSYEAAIAVAHELGHVLGLGHETRGCSLMNPAASFYGPSLCPKAEPWQWRCGLLTADDANGAVALYGGAAAPMTGRRDCDLYPGIHAPTNVEVTMTEAAHVYRVSFRRPPALAVPGFLYAGRSRQPEAFVSAAVLNRCPTDAHKFPRRPWRTAPGGLDETYLSLASGTYCVTVWAVDSFSTPSPRPAAFSVRIV